VNNKTVINLFPPFAKGGKVKICTVYDMIENYRAFFENFSASYKKTSHCPVSIMAEVSFVLISSSAALQASRSYVGGGFSAKRS